MRFVGIFATTSLLLCSFPPAVPAQWPPVFRIATIDELEPGQLGYPAAMSLRVDAQGRPHIAYKSYGGLVRYATCPADQWQVETAGGARERDCSLLLDSTGNPWILFMGGLLQRTGDGWMAHLHPFGYVEHIGGVMAADGTVHACFMQSWSGGIYYGTTEYVWYRNGTWYEGPGETEEAFTHPGAVISMDLTSTGVPRLAVTNKITHDPEVRYWPDAQSMQAMFTIPHAILGSLAVDAQDQSHVAYYDTQAHALEYAVFSGSSWNISPVDTDGDIGRYASLAVDNNGGAHIAYYDATHQDLRYARRSPSSSEWTTCVVDSVDDVGTWVSLDVDARGSVHVAYIYKWDTRYIVKYATTSPAVAIAPGSWSAVKSAYR